MKKILSLLFAGIITMFAAITVQAATNGSIEINRTETNYDTVYNAYRILDLSYDETNQSYAYTLNSTWKDFFTTGAGKDYVTIDRDYVKFKDSKKGAADVAEFAKKALAYAEEKGITPIKSTTIAKGNKKATISGLELGYYLVDSSLGALCHLSSTDLKAVINEKNAEPTIVKTATSQLNNNSAKIGDKIDYNIDVNVAAGYKKYVVTDKMTSGLTFNNDITIKYIDAAGNEITEKTGESILTTSTSSYTFKIDFSNVDLSNVSIIKISYSATINENAIDDNSSQTNNAKLSFGNNNQTSSSSTSTNTYEVSFKKINDRGTELYGAKFRLYDSEKNGNEIKVVKVSDGIYRVATADETGEDIEAGTVIIKGLANTTYYLEEIAAPEGYTKLATRIAITSGSGEMVPIVNTTGTVLPSTGGMGTTLFVTIGTIMVLTLGIVLISKYRMTKFNA